MLQLSIRAQPDDSTCGPTCLHAVYTYWKDKASLSQMISEIGQLPDGGTLAVHLACHALARGYEATIYTYNLQLFDPTWFDQGTSRPRSLGLASVDLSLKLREQLEHKPDWKVAFATEAYLKFLELGGQIAMEPLGESLIVGFLLAGKPILAGLSATYLYREPRERPILRQGSGPSAVPDDVAGSPVGHFVVLFGYDKERRRVRIADPMWPNPMAPDHYYEASLTRVAAALHLGIITYDANLLVLSPKQTVSQTDRKDS